jgi:hypothetical protein
MDFQLYVPWFDYAYFSNESEGMVFQPMTDTDELRQSSITFTILQPETLFSAQGANVSGGMMMATASIDDDDEEELYQPLAIPNSSSMYWPEHEAGVSSSSSSGYSFGPQYTISNSEPSFNSILDDLDPPDYIPPSDHTEEVSHTGHGVFGTSDTTATENEVMELVEPPAHSQTDPIFIKTKR